MKRADPEPRPVADDASTVRSVGRAIGLLRSIAASGRDGCRFTDLCASSGLSKSTVHRILAALEDEGVVEQDPASKRFFPGIELFLLGTASAARFGIVELARPSLVHLADATGDTVFLSVPVDDDAVCADRQLGAFPIRTLTVDIGDRRPLGLGSGGLALLAFLDDDALEARLAANQPRLSAHRHFEPAGMRRLIAAARKQGYSAIDGLIVEGMSAIGVPIRGVDGQPVGALSVAAITSRLAGGRRRTVVAKMVAEARRIERQLAVLGGARTAAAPDGEPAAKRRA